MISQSFIERAAVAVSALAGSILFLLLGPYSNFAAAGYLDPWFYTGYFTNFSYLLHHYGQNYFVSRLPWIIPGLLAFRIASPETASVMLNVAIVTASLIALYWSVRWHYGRTPAMLACCALLVNPYFISTVAWDYPDGPAIAYLFAALAFAVRPHSNPAWNTIRTGIFLTLAGLTNLSALPVIAALLVFVLWRRQWKTDTLRLVAGAAGTVLVLCPIAQVLVGKWTFFYWQIYQAIHTFGNPGYLEKMWGSGPAFLLTATRLLAPVLLLAATPFLLLRRKASGIVLPAWISLALALGLYTIQEFVFHGVALRVPYLTSYLIAPLFFLAGVLLGEAWQFRTRWLAAAAMLAMLFLTSSRDPAINYMWDHPAGANLRTFRDLMALQTYLKSSVNPERRVQFWIDTDEQLPIYYSAEALYLYIHHDLTQDLTAAPATTVREELPPNTTLVHLTLHPDRLEARRHLLTTRGITIANERTTQLPWTTVVLEDITDLSQLR